MANIEIQRKPSAAWLWWVVGALAIALGLWALLAGGDEDLEQAPAIGAAPVADDAQPLPPSATPTAQGEGITLSQIIESPGTSTGKSLAGEFRVGDVPTDRGFWIMDQGQRLFVILGDAPEEQPKDINANQTLRLTEAVVYSADQLGSIPGQLDADTRRIAEEQAVVLYVDERNVDIL